MRFRTWSLVAIIFLFSGVASADVKTLDTTAACTGVIIGNGSLDYSYGDEDAFVDATRIAYTGYIGHIAAHEYKKEDLEFASQILYGNIDKIIQQDANMNWSDGTYEEIIKCYNTISISIMKNQHEIANNNSRIEKLAKRTIKKIKRFIDATKN